MAKENAEVEITKEQQNEIIRTYENDIIAGLLKAADFRDDPDEEKEIQIIRNKVLLFKFRIHPLSEDEFLATRKKHTRYVKNKQVGTRVAESVDSTAYRSECIYIATVAEDREAIWDNRTAWDKLNVLNGIDMIEAVLKGGEKAAVYEMIENISAYNEDIPQTVKN